LSGKVSGPLVANQVSRHGPPGACPVARSRRLDLEFGFVNVLITGGCGYIGSALAPHMRSLGHQVKTLDTVGPADIKADYREFSSARYREFETIIHLAGHSSVKACQEQPQQALYNNLLSFLKCLRKLAPDQHLLWASSASVLSPVGSNLYDATKRACEAMVPVLHPRSSALRFGTVCGWSPSMRWDLMLNKMALDAFTNGIVTVSNPNAHRPVLGMMDLRNAVSMIAEAGDPGVYNLSSVNQPIGTYAASAAAHFDAEIRSGPDSQTYNFAMPQTLIRHFTPMETIDSILDDLRGGLAHRA
jgi:UDP-glucose 4-epimerase